MKKSIGSTERKKILKEFKVDNYGIIQDPGKFEGEMLYAPYFYEMIMNGTGDEIYAGDTVYTTFIVEDEDRKEFPELRDIFGIICYETEQGFFYAASYDNKEHFNEDITNLEEADEAEGEEP